MDVAGEDFEQQLTQAIEKDPPDFDQLCSLAADFIISKDACEHLANLARQDEERSVLRVAGFLEVVASQLEPTTDVDIAGQALRFIGNACIGDDASKQIMLRPPLIGHVAYFLQLNTVAQIALGCLTNIFIDNYDDEDEDALTELVFCSAISQGVHKILCRRLLFNVKTRRSRTYTQYAYELLGLLQRLCPTSQHSELCRCNDLDVDFYADLIQVAINWVPESHLLNANPPDTSTSTNTDTDVAHAIAEIAPDNMSELEAPDLELLDDIYGPLIDFLTTPRCIEFAAGHGMIRELLPLFESMAAYYHTHPPLTPSGMGPSKVMTLAALQLTRFQGLVLDIQEKMEYGSPVALHSDRLFMLYIAGLRHEHEEVVELSALVLGNIANTNDVAVAMVREHGLVREALRSLSLAKLDRTLWALYGLIRQLAVPISNAVAFVQDSLLYVITPGQAAKLVDHRAELMAWRAIRLVCRGIAGPGVSAKCFDRLSDTDWLPAIETRWKFLDRDIQPQIGQTTATLYNVRVEIARVIISLLRFANKALITPLKSFPPQTDSNVFAIILWLAQQTAMPKVAAEGWFGLGLLASLSWSHAQHTYEMLKSDQVWIAFGAVAKSAGNNLLEPDRQEQMLDPESAMHEGDLVSSASVDKRGKYVALNQQAANARWLANHLAVTLGEEMLAEHREQTRQWLSLTSNNSNGTLEDQPVTSGRTDAEQLQA